MIIMLIVILIIIICLLFYRKNENYTTCSKTYIEIAKEQNNKSYNPKKMPINYYISYLDDPKMKSYNDILINFSPTNFVGTIDLTQKCVKPLAITT